MMLFTLEHATNMSNIIRTQLKRRWHEGEEGLITAQIMVQSKER